MAKGQMKSGREAKKPKKSALEKAKTGAVPGLSPSSKSATTSYSDLYKKK